MKSEKFVSCLRSIVIEENLAIYRQLFENTLIEKASDPYWKHALTLFNNLNLQQQQVFFKVMRQVALDTTSNILGVIDGVSFLDGAGTEFELISIKGNCRSVISGDLQELFLAEDE